MSPLSLDEADQITHSCHLIRLFLSDFHAAKLVLDGDYQFETVEPIGAEIFNQARLVRNAPQIDVELRGDEASERGADLFVRTCGAADHHGDELPRIGCVESQLPHSLHIVAFEKNYQSVALT
jgi:hypothetical protein